MVVGDIRELKNSIDRLSFRLKEKEDSRNEYTRSINDKEHFSPNAIRQFKKVRTNLTKEISAIKRELNALKHQFKNHADYKTFKV